MELASTSHDRHRVAAATTVYRSAALPRQSDAAGDSAPLSSLVGNQDLLDIGGLGITAAKFATSVTIKASGANTLITIGTNSIQLNGVAAGTVTAADFRLAP